MNDGNRPCPVCQQPLGQALRGGLVTWECRDGHGVGVILTEAYRHLQRDELEAIATRTAGAPVSDLQSPISGEPMLQVTFPVDADAHTSHLSATTDMTIEVDPANAFGWFSLEELQAMPRDETGRAAARPGLIGLDQMDEEIDAHGQVFSGLTDADYVDSDEADEDSSFDRLMHRLAGRLRR